MKFLACTSLVAAVAHKTRGGKERTETHDILLVAIIEIIGLETRLEVYLHGIDRYSASRQETENRSWGTKSARRLFVMTRCWIYSQGHWNSQWHLSLRRSSRSVLAQTHGRLP